MKKVLFCLIFTSFIFISVYAQDSKNVSEPAEVSQVSLSDEATVSNQENLEKTENQTTQKKEKKSKALKNTPQKNDQKIWSVDSEVYKYLTYLFVSEGHALPNSIGPWSTDELKKMLALIDEPANENSKVLYDKIYSILYAAPRFSTGDNFSFGFNGSFAPELYVHTNQEDFCNENDWYYDYEKRNKLLLIDLDAYAANHFYFFMNAFFGYTSCINVTSGETNYEKLMYSPNFMSNIPYLPMNNLALTDVNFPSRSFASAGGEHWSLSFGRDKIRWGNGETGNLFLGGNSEYDNNFRFSTYYNNFKFTFLTNVYPHDSDIHDTGRYQSVDGLKMFLAHRIDVRLFKDKVSFGVAEGLMYQSATNTMDVRYLNPTQIFHSFFLHGNGNSLLTVDLDFTPIKGLNIYGQFDSDDIAFFEPSTESEKGGNPQKLGFLGGVRYVHPFKYGVLKVNLEGVYCDPAMYLREKYNPDDMTQGVGLMIYTKEFNNITGIKYIRKCIGYTYGGDCVVGDLNACFDSLGKWKTGVDFFFMAHGIMYNDLNTDWVIGKQVHSPSTVDQTINPSNPSGVPEYFFRASINSNYQFFNWLSVNAGIDNWFIWNKDNIQRSMVYDFQFYSGVVITF